MQTDNKADKPLYKVLNEKRTSGVFIVDGDLIVCTDNPNTYPKSYNDGIVIFEAATAKNTTDDSIVAHFEQTLPNSQYTALAVNNLESIADALQYLLSSYKADFKQITGAELNETEAVKKAKEALSKIS